MNSEDNDTSNGPHLTAFVDANIVLEGRPLKELPWDEVQAAGTIHLLIVPKAMEEIDAKKRDGRLGPVARAFNNLIAPSVTEGAAVIIRESSPHVDLAMAVCNRVPWEDYNELDPDDGDGRIVAEALHARGVDPDLRVLISHDIKPLAYAKGRQLAVHRASDSWLRPIEPSPKDKEIQRLKQQVSELRKDEPRFDIEIEVSDLDPFRFVKIETLTEEQSLGILKKIKTSNRKKSQDQDRLGFGIRSLDYDASYDGRHAKFISETVPRFVTRFNENIERFVNQRHFSIRVKNSGQIRADHLQIKVEINDGWLNKNIAFVSPQGPLAPSPRSRFDEMSTIRDMIQPRVGRHEYEFTTKARRTPDMVVTCEDFRNGQEFYFKGIAAPTSEAGMVTIKVTLTASNMRGGVTQTFSREKVIDQVPATSVVDLDQLKVIGDYPVKEALGKIIEERAFNKLDWGRDADDDE